MPRAKHVLNYIHNEHSGDVVHPLMSMNNWPSLTMLNFGHAEIWDNISVMVCNLWSLSFATMTGIVIGAFTNISSAWKTTLLLELDGFCLLN